MWCCPRAWQWREGGREGGKSGKVGRVRRCASPVGVSCTRLYIAPVHDGGGTRLVGLVTGGPMWCHKGAGAEAISWRLASPAAGRVIGASCGRQAVYHKRQAGLLLHQRRDLML